MTALAVRDCAAAGGEVAAAVDTLRRDHAAAPLDSGWAQSLLRSLCFGSAGVVVLISGYEPFFRHVGTSSSVVDRRPRPSPAKTAQRPSSSTYRQALAMSVPDQLRKVLAALALNKSQLAEVLRVTRPTLYGWFDGKEPNPANAGRLASLLRLLARSGITSTTPLNAKFVRQPLEEGIPSLLDELRAENLNEDPIAQLLREARVLGESVDARRRGREDRLRDLGYEEPSDEQRRDQLARNVASLDWSKR